MHSVGGPFREYTTFSVSRKEPQDEGTGGADAPASLGWGVSD